MNIPFKSLDEIEIMREGGKITAGALHAMKDAVRPGITTLELDEIAEKVIRMSGAEPSFMKVDDYKYSICASVNDEVVHGLPTQYVLLPGDVVGLDVGAFYKGFHTDLSYSVLITETGYWEPSDEDMDRVELLLFNKAERASIVAQRESQQFDEMTDEEKKLFLTVGKRALMAAREKALIGGYIGDISSVLQKYIEAFGYSVVRELIGHGVGKELHEPPQIPGLGREGTGPVMKEGMVLAIEAIYTSGKPEVAYKNKDGWTIATGDYSMSGLYEFTVVVSEKGPEVLTLW